MSELVDFMIVAAFAAAVFLVARWLILPGSPPPFVEYRPPAPIDASGWKLVVDGSNLSYKRSEPALEHLDAVLDELRRRFENAEMHVFCDANLRYKFEGEEREEFLRRVKSGCDDARYVETHGMDADEVFLQYAQVQERAIVVSNDRFNKSPDELRWRAGVPLLKVMTSGATPRPRGMVEIHRDAAGRGTSVLVSRYIEQN